MEEKRLYGIDDIVTEVGNEHLLSLCSYPFLFYNDYGRGYKTVSSLFSNVVQVSKIDRKSIEEHCSKGDVVFLQEEKTSMNILNKIEFGWNEKKKVIVIDDEIIEVADGFRLFVSSPSIHSSQWKFIVLNMEYSEIELQREIFTNLGKQNWQEIQLTSDNSRKAVREDNHRLEELETKMLELLGRTEEDLDDEGAVELLAESHEIQERLKEKEKEMEVADGKLEKEKEKYGSLVNWIVELILFIRQFSKYTPFYNIDIEMLIRVADTKIQEKELVMERPPAIWERFWELAAPPFEPYYRKLLLMGLKHLHRGQKIIEKELAIFDNDDPDLLKMFSRLMWTIDSREPILIAETSPTCEIAVKIQEISRGTSVQWTSFPEYSIQNIDQYIDNPLWLAITLSDHQKLEEVDKLRDHLKNVPSLNPSFRLLVVIPSVHCSSVCLSFPTRFCFSSPSTLCGLLQQTIISSTFRHFFSSGVRSKRSNAMRLVIFHFAVRKRIEGIDDTELRISLTLLKETSYEEGKEHDDLFMRIISTVYLPRTRNKVEKAIVEALFQWIYQGLNKTDDSMIKTVVGGEFETETILEKLGKMDEEIFTGKGKNRIKNERERRYKKMMEEFDCLARKKVIERGKEIEEEQNDKTGILRGSEISWKLNFEENEKRIIYLTSLFHRDSSFDDIVVIRNPFRIIAILAVQFSISFKVPLNEIIVFGFIESKESLVTSNQVILQNCVIKGAAMEKDELKEQKTEEEQKVRIVLEAGIKQEMKKTGRTLPLVDKRNHLLCDVFVKTNISMSHWFLRGAHFTIY